MSTPRVFYTPEEEADIRSMHRDDYLAKYAHINRSASSWRNKRNKLGLHTNPGLDEFGNIWGATTDTPVSETPITNVPTPDAPGPVGSGVSVPSVTNIVGVQAGERPDVEAIKAKHKATFRRTIELAQRKHFQQISISHAPAMLVFVSDTHLGSPGTDVDRIYAEQEMVNSTPGAYTFLLGDIADSFLVGRLKDINTTHDVTIPEEWALVEDYINRWKNLLGFVGGNHDKWSHSLVGMDLHRRLINDGKVLYDTDDMRLTVNIGPYPIRLRLRHQFLGRSQYNVSHASEKSVKFDDPWPDVLVSGHTHTGALARELSHAGKRKIAIQLGSYKMVDDFAISLGLPRTDTSTAAALIVMPNGKYFATGELAAACSFMHAVYQGVA